MIKKWYHGGPKMSNWTESNYDRDRSSSDLNAEGPGIYWTSDKEEAQGYMHGTNATLYSATLSGFKPLPNKKPTMQFLTHLYNSASDNQKEIFLSNWVLENPRLFKIALNHYMHQNTMLDAAITLYHDLFQYNSNSYINAMRSAGYDGVIVKRGTTGGSKKRDHLIIWNPAVLIISEEE